MNTQILPDVYGRLARTVACLVELLVARAYVDVEHLTDGVRLSAHEIEEAISEYGKTLILPPESAYSDLDAIQLRGRLPATFSVRFPLYTLEEGLSDLEVQLTTIDNPNSQVMRVEIDGILVA